MEESNAGGLFSLFTQGYPPSPLPLDLTKQRSYGVTLPQVFDFKELKGKIFNLNDLLPHGARKFFILRFAVRPRPHANGAFYA